MQNHFVVLILTLAAMMVTPRIVLPQSAAPQSRAEAGAKTAASTPNLSGVWWRGRGGERRASAVNEAPPPMTPAGKEKYHEFVKNLIDAPAKERGENRNLMDPMIRACAPPGPPRLLLTPRSFEIIQSQNKIAFLYEIDHWVRHIWMDGRKHPAELDATWMGHSIGSWEGDTLVVDTVGISDKTWLTNGGFPHTEALHLIERYRRVNQNSLELNYEFQDPTIYTKSWKGKLTYTPDPSGELFEGVSCGDRINEMLKKDPCETGAWEIEVLCAERRERKGK